MNAIDLLDHDLRHTTTPVDDRTARDRAELTATRRRARRQRLARRVRSVADRLEA